MPGVTVVALRIIFPEVFLPISVLRLLKTLRNDLNDSTDLPDNARE